MFTILIDSNNATTVTQKEVITKGSKLVDKIHFLTDPTYKDIDMTDFDVMIEYVLPISKTYCTENLVKSEELYKDMLEYVLPVDTNMTKEAGDIELKVTFTKLEQNPDDETTPIQYVRKIQSCKIHISDVANWSDFIPDKALDALDQRILKLDAIANQLNNASNQGENTETPTENQPENSDNTNVVNI